MTQPVTPGDDGTYVIWGAVLSVLGVLLLVAELFIPSGGLIAVLAGIATVGAVIAYFLHDSTLGFASLVAYAILIPIAAVFFFKVVLNSSIGRRMILDSDVTTGSGRLPATESGEDDSLRVLIGRTGRAETALRPVGVVRIEGRRLNAIAEAGLIDAATDIVVTDVYDNQVKVRAANP